MEREKTRSTDWDRDRTRDRDRASERDRTPDRSSEQGGSLARQEYGSASILGRDPRLSPGFEMMRTMMREMMRPFGELFQGSSAMMGIPPVEIFDRDGRMVVRVDLPGVDREDVKVRVVDDAL